MVAYRFCFVCAHVRT